MGIFTHCANKYRGIVESVKSSVGYGITEESDKTINEILKKYI